MTETVETTDLGYVLDLVRARLEDPECGDVERAALERMMTCLPLIEG